MPAVTAALAQLGDCEAIHDGWLKQPVNAWSSLAFSVVGAAIVAFAAAAEGRERRDRIVVGALLFATGVGSFLFHGPQPASGGFLHDVTFLAALWYLGAANLTASQGVDDRRTLSIEAGGIVVIAAILLAAPDSTNVLAGLLAVGLIATDVILWRRTPPDRRWYVAALAALAIAAALFAAGRTGSPLCESEGLLQGHAGWHVFAAVFLGSYVVATVPARTRGSR